MAKNTVSRKEALELRAEAISESVDDVQPGVELVTLSGWDSMAVLLLMAEFDDRFDIVLDEEGRLNGILEGRVSGFDAFLKRLENAGIIKENHAAIADTLMATFR